MSINKVLIVEDSQLYSKYLVNQLSLLGFDVVLAENYSQAQDILSQQSNFLCALLDYCLPDAENGEVIDLAFTYGLKVIVLTAHFNEQTRKDIIAKGAIDYMTKDSLTSISYLPPLLKRLARNNHHKVLVVDDSQTVRKHLTDLLQHHYLECVEAEDGEEALTVLNQNPDVTLIITDHHMPKKDGVTMTAEIRSQFDRNQIAILGLSATDNESLTARFLKAGANDYLKKPFNQEEFYCRVQNILDMKDINDDMFRMANEDALTGLWNRRYLFNNADTNQEQCNVAVMDIDFFKKVNDNYGHDGGDQALIMVSKIISVYFANDLAARTGGEEFCIVNYGDYDDFVSRLENMRARIEKTPIPYDGKEISLTISIGCTKAKRNIDTMISIADDRLYDAKNSGRNRVIAT
ncbi:response regulator [Vibrio hannami]|uniref:response regulator n=1 Tax=Vibrio hannami TaxID=2717094 RepID=UPI002410A10C|nr:response regulator [Vibrio hannami]MDG3087379.1 response regulator [Vibrio hannami]